MESAVSATTTQHPTYAPARIARLWRCLAAMFYDGLLLLALNFLVAFAVINISTPGVAAQHQQLWVLPGWVRHGLILPAVIITTGLFYSYFWVRNQQTLGMQTWHIRIESWNGERLRWRQAMQRFIFAFTGFCLVGLGYWWSFIDRQGLSLHDRLSKTRIVLVPRERSSR